MASVKVQMEELKKPNPRYVLELLTIRRMIQEVDNMDKGLKAVYRGRKHTQCPLVALPLRRSPRRSHLPQPSLRSSPHPPIPTSLRSLEGATFYRESRLEDIKIEMSKLEIHE